MPGFGMVSGEESTEDDEQDHHQDNGLASTPYA